MEGNFTEKNEILISTQNNLIPTINSKENDKSFNNLKKNENLFLEKEEKTDLINIENNNSQKIEIENNSSNPDYNVNTIKRKFSLSNLEANQEKKLLQKKLKYLYKKVDSCSSLLWSHDNHITGKRLRSENDQEDNKLNWKNRETTQTGYGEIALGSMTSLLNLFQNISKLIQYHCEKSEEFKELLLFEPEEYNMNKDSSFLDIGSGFGKPVFHSALQVGCFSKGVEVVPARAEFCLDFFYEFLNEKNFFEDLEEKFLESLNNEYSNNKNQNKKENEKEQNEDEIDLDEKPNGNSIKEKSNESELDKEYEQLNMIIDENEKMDIDEENTNKESNKNNEKITSSSRTDSEMSDSNKKSEKGNNKSASKKDLNNLSTIKKADNKEDEKVIDTNISKFDATTNLTINNNNQKDSNGKENTAYNENKPHIERNIMFHELKKISGDSYLNSLDFNMTFSQRNLRNKKIINNDFSSNNQLNGVLNKNNSKQNKKGVNGYNYNGDGMIQLDLKNIVKLNDLNAKYYNEVLKDKSSIYIELKLNPDIIYEDSFVEHLINKRNFQINNDNFIAVKDKRITDSGILVPEYCSNNLLNFGNHFVLNEITIEITAINDLLYSNILKLIANCLFADTFEKSMAKRVGVFYDNLKVDFNNITNKIENKFVLDLIHLTNTYFYVGRKYLDINKIMEIIKKSIDAGQPDILEYCSEYLILNKANFAFLQNKENLNFSNLNLFSGDNPFEYLDFKKGSIRNVKLAGLFNQDITRKGRNNGKNNKSKNNGNNQQLNKIKDLYEELEKQLKNKNLENILNNNNEKITSDSQTESERIAGMSKTNGYIDEISQKKLEQEKINDLVNDTKILKEILVDFKYNIINDWAKKLVFVSEDATKCKAYMADKKNHFSHIYSYNKLMSKECRSKIAKILNKTKFKVLAWYSNPKQTRKAGLKNFTFLSKFPMQSTSTEKFHVYVYIKSK